MQGYVIVLNQAGKRTEHLVCCNEIDPKHGNDIDRVAKLLSVKHPDWPDEFQVSRIKAGDMTRFGIEWLSTRDD